jgi:hypothetical protein
VTSIGTLSGSAEDPKFRAASVYVVWLLVISFVRILVEVDLDENLRARTATIEMAGNFFPGPFPREVPVQRLELRLIHPAYRRKEAL